MGLLHGTQRALLGGLKLPKVGFSLSDITFTERMAKRAGNGPFAAAPIVQGDWDGTGTPDVLSYSRGSLLGNATQYWYDNFDPYQGTITLWVTPEWAGNDGIEHNIFYISSNYRLFKTTGDLLQLTTGGQSVTIDISAWTAGTTYFVAASWDTKNTLDGTNYARLTVNATHTFGASTQPTASAPAATLYCGSTDTPTLAADAIPEGVRRNLLPSHRPTANLRRFWLR
jgi:hypothetical protein